MKCLNPKIHFPRRISMISGREQKVPVGYSIMVGCGKCPLCLSARAKKWATQCQYEANLTDQKTHCNIFATLTYNPENLPENNSLSMPDVRKFLHDFRGYLKRYNMDYIRHFLAGEYGDKDGRPHYHILLFNVPRTLIAVLSRGQYDYDQCYFPLLEKAWRKGFISVSVASPYRNAVEKYITQSHQKGGSNYWQYEKVKTPEDYHYKTKREWRNAIGQLRPFRLMSRGLGLKALNMVDPEFSHKIEIGADGYIKPPPRDCQDMTGRWHYVHKNLESSSNKCGATGNKYYEQKKYGSLTVPHTLSEKIAFKQNYKRISDIKKMQWQKAIYDAGLMKLTDKELIDKFCGNNSFVGGHLSNQEALQERGRERSRTKYQKLLYNAGDNVNERLTVISMMIAQFNAVRAYVQYLYAKANWRTVVGTARTGLTLRQYL